MKETNKKKNSFTKEIVGEFNEPTYTQENLDMEKIWDAKMKELGIIPGLVCDGGCDAYTKDESKAIMLIIENKEVPQELADRIIQYHKDNPRPKSNYKMKALSPKIIEKILGIKVKDQ
jgi:hypothetical protein